MEIVRLEDRAERRRSKQLDHSELDGVFPIPKLGADVGDIPEDKALVTSLDLLFIVISIFTHIIDLGTDLNLALSYLLADRKWHFYLTSTFLFIPSFINIVVSVRMYQQTYEMNPEARKHQTFSSRVVQKKILWPLILFLQFSPVLRYIDCLKYAYRCYQSRRKEDRFGQKIYYLKMLKEEQDICLLRVFECFLEAAPHQVLQLTLMIMDYNPNDRSTYPALSQGISIISSLGSMGWAMSSYHKTIRLAQGDKENISWIGNWIQFLWHFFVTVSRIVAISAAAAIYYEYTLVFCFIHWLIMTIWISKKPTGVIQLCRNRSKPPHSPLKLSEWIGIYMFSSVLGVLYVFTYLKSAEGSTFYKHIFYYTFCAIENAAACILWSLAERTLSFWFYEMVICLCTIPFAIGVGFMIIFYVYFHPSMNKAKTNEQSVPQDD